MPALAFLAWVGLALVALLFVADATLEDRGPAIITSDRIGLPEPWHPDMTQTPAIAPIPAPEMTSQAELDTQFESAAEAQTIEPVARTARAEALPKKKRVTRQPTDRKQAHIQQSHVQQNNLFDRFSIRDQ
jgi:hypothetical protein